MRKVLSLVILLAGWQFAGAQSSFSLTEGEAALVYSLPATELCFELEIEKTVEKPGVFYQYSQRYLAAEDIILEENTNYALKDIRLVAHPVPDASRKFSVVPQANTAMSRIVVDGQGLLCGVNVSSDVPGRPEMRLPDPEKQKSCASAAGKDVLPLTQEYMLAGSTAKLAEGAARQIYIIRESRLNILTGEMEQMPADGDALKTMLAGLDKQEKQLTELFTGSVRKEIIKKRITMIPVKAGAGEVLFRLSSKRGLTDKNDMGGEPYYLSLMPEKMDVVKPDPRARQEAAALYTVLPARTMLKVTNGVNVLLEKTLDIPQFGQLIPLPQSLFKSSSVKIKIDVPTGRLISIE